MMDLDVSKRVAGKRALCSQVKLIKEKDLGGRKNELRQP
ncbi:hypothetical protein DESAMIL20_806 [Desulfurella amilsii]|uniref:Uncharacterized protein n=1 Tax=Desulfurella amilsii TaxID=1562698 RepID=A0A1X4XUP1_9BACT|nr:hypothetical protein DESAMIL20_806 [Desulfurella amilsii]